MKIGKIKYYYLGKGWRYLLPRFIIIAYPVIIVGQALVYSVIFGFNLEGFVIALIAAVLSAGIVYMCLKLQLLGGLTLLFLGGFIVLGSLLADGGFDWMGILFGGLPLLLAGVMFLSEVLMRQQRLAKIVEMLEKNAKSEPK